MLINDLCKEHLEVVERVKKVGNSLVRENIKEYALELDHCLSAIEFLRCHALSYLSKETIKENK